MAAGPYEWPDAMDDSLGSRCGAIPRLALSALFSSRDAPSIEASHGECCLVSTAARLAPRWIKPLGATGLNRIARFRTTCAGTAPILAT